MGVDPGDGTQVELTEDAAATDAHEAPGAAGTGGRLPAGPATARSRRRAAAAVLVLAVALVAGTLASSAVDRADDDAVALLATRPGFAGSLREPLVELWVTQDRLVGAAHGLVLVADRSTPAVLRAREAGTGQELWTAAAATDVTRCDGVGAVLLCEVPGSGLGAPNTDELLGEVPGALLVLDAADGRVLRRSDLDGRTVGWVTAGDDVVVARRAADRLVLTRRPALVPGTTADGASGGSRWTVELPLPPASTANQLALRRDDDLLVVEGRVGAVVAADDGAVVVAPQVAARPGGLVQVVTSATGAAVWAEGDLTSWFDRSGVPLTTLSGGPVREVPHDGSAPEVLLLDREGALVAVDAASGDDLWERPAVPWRRVSRVGGAVVVVEPGAVVRVDATSGAEAWRWPLTGGAAAAAPPPGAVVLDARRLLLGGSLTGGGPAVLGLADGVQQWSGTASVRGALRPGTGPAVVLAYGLHGVAAWGVPPA